MMTDFHPLRRLLVLLLSLFWATMGSAAALAERSDFDRCAIAANSGRALKMPALDGSLAGTNTLGVTMPNGQVFLRPGLSRAEQVATLRHESVHAYLSVPDGAPLASLRQNVGMWGYNNSHLLRFTEEALAEGYASRSLMQGLRHPLHNGYGISIPRLTLEAGAVGAGIGGAAYLGYQLGSGE
jgi:hypothetical protein